MYHYYDWKGAAHSKLSIFDEVQNRWHCREGYDTFSPLESLSNRHNIASLSHLSKSKDQMSSHSWIPLVQTFISRTSHVSSIESNHPHFFRVQMLRECSTTAAFLRELLLCVRHSQVDASMKTSILTTSIQMSFAIYPLYLLNIQFIVPLLTIQTTFYNPLP